MQEKNTPLTPLKAKAVVALATLLVEESEESVWEVIEAHYELNHGTRVEKGGEYGT